MDSPKYTLPQLHLPEFLKLKDTFNNLAMFFRRYASPSDFRTPDIAWRKPCGKPTCFFTHGHHFGSQHVFTISFVRPHMESGLHEGCRTLASSQQTMRNGMTPIHQHLWLCGESPSGSFPTLLGSFPTNRNLQVCQRKTPNNCSMEVKIKPIKPNLNPPPPPP